MEVLALIESPNHVCYRYRIAAFAAALARRDFTLRPVALRLRTLSRTRQLLDSRRPHTVILQRRLLPRWQIRILRHAARRIIFDFDDAVFQRDSYHRKGQHCRRKLARFKATVQAADMVTVGNDHLRQAVLRYVEPDRVRVIPTCVDPTLYRPANHSRAGQGIRLAWIGSSSTMPGLQLIQRHLAVAGERVPGLELHVICDRAVELTGVRTVLREWSSQTEAADLADCDVGISCLPDDPWSRGKCGLKVLQYMAAGLPVVANPVGTSPEMVIPGETGFLADTPEEWAEAIRLLASDPELRHKLGTAGRRLVQQRYSVARWEEPFAAVIAGNDNLSDTGPSPSGKASVKRPAWMMSGRAAGTTRG
jgi:glycosyltransferase involved in cell wall biosynthesis